jgi:LytR cell envelope-related transcriptional attenuator
MKALTVLALAVACGGDGGGHAFPVPGERDPRITVEVLNASGRAGLARTGTRLLRQGGIDVVFFGNAGATVGTLDSTRIIVRRGSGDAGERVRAVLQLGQVVVERDSARLLDVSVLLGRDFAPRLGFHP